MALVLCTLHLSCLIIHVAGLCYPRNGFKCCHVFFFKSSRFIAEALPERAVIPQELSASEPKVIQCVASKTVDHGIHATTRLERRTAALQFVPLL